jgi:hypothetical protein
MTDKVKLSSLVMTPEDLSVSPAITGPPCPDRSLKDGPRIHEKINVLTKDERTIHGR